MYVYKQPTDQQENLKNYVNVWYRTKAISNVLSLRYIKNKNHTIYYSGNVDILIVINKIPGGQYMIFTINKYGLYYNNMSNTKLVSTISTVE